MLTLPLFHRPPFPPTIRFTSNHNVSSEGFSFSYYSVSAPGGSCGDGVVSSIEACDPALSPTCRFDCTTTSAANVGTLTTRRNDVRILLDNLLQAIFLAYSHAPIPYPAAQWQSGRAVEPMPAIWCMPPTWKQSSSPTNQPRTRHAYLSVRVTSAAIFRTPPN